MRILVIPVGMSIGGSEINALDLATQVYQRGHEVVLSGTPGPMASVARAAGLPVETIEMPSRGRPRPASIRAIRAVIEAVKPDLVHVWEPDLCVEAFYAAELTRRVPVIASLYGMRVEDHLPRAMAVVAGTRQMQQDLGTGRDSEAVYLLEPPVNTVANSPDTEVGAQARASWGISDGELLVVVVSRLDVWMKLDALMDSIDAVDQLARRRSVRLFVFGDGPARLALERRARLANERHGREVIRLVGAVIDPVPAYRAADVVLGMGTSILRAMAIGRPAVLTGELGYCRPILPDTVAPLLQQGFWGVGDGTRAVDALATMVEEALDQAPCDAALNGAWSRQFVIDHFGLEQATDRLLTIYEHAAHWQPGRRRLLTEALRVPVALLRRKATDRLPSRRRGATALRRSPTLGDDYLSATAWELAKGDSTRQRTRSAK